MAIGVWPCETQVGTVQGKSGLQLGAEIPLTQWFERRAKAAVGSFVNSGMGVSAVGGALSVTVAVGHCVIGGRYVEITSTETVTGLTASVTQYLFLQLTFTSSKVTGTQWVKQTSTTPPSDSVCVARVVTNGTQATTITNAAQPTAGSYVSTYSGTGVQFLGWRPTLIVAYGPTDGSAFQLAISAPVGVNGRFLSNPGGTVAITAAAFEPTDLGFTIATTGGTHFIALC